MQNDPPSPGSKPPPLLLPPLLPDPPSLDSPPDEVPLDEPPLDEPLPDDPLPDDPPDPPPDDPPLDELVPASVETAVEEQPEKRRLTPTKEAQKTAEVRTGPPKKLPPPWRHRRTVVAPRPR
jgi:hypothetical protein